MALPVASTTTSSSLVRLRAKPSSPDRVMSTRPWQRSRPSSQNTTSAKVRWMSIPTTCFIALPSSHGHGSGGLHDNYGSALAAQPGGSQGWPATNSSSQLIVCIGLPTPHAPSTPQPGWSHHTRRSADPRRARRHQEHHAGYQCHRGAQLEAPPGGPREGPFPDRRSSDEAAFPGLEPRREGVEDAAS